MAKKLKCGCRRGDFLCREAVRLWGKVNAAYRDGDWEGYKKVREEYERHFERDKPND